MNRPYATPQELADYLGVPLANLPGATLYLELASRRIEAAAPRLAEAAITDATAPEIKPLCLTVAARAFDNPSGKLSENIGTYSTTYGGDNAFGRGGAALTNEEVESLSRFRDTAGSIPISPWRNLEWATDVEGL